MTLNRSRKGWLLAASFVVVALLVVLWRATAPIRIRHQFEAQAVAQLANTTMGKGNKFSSIRVISFRYNSQSDAYDVQYQLNYGNPDYPSSTWSSCSLYRRDGSFQSECLASSPLSSAPMSSFNISIPE
ncbi:hypothetical protein IAD21_04054 [Abditibacteriota bacterium]|nr:hypothetical protein IAD21_04054 [Abditibacteriota bacterium]